MNAHSIAVAIDHTALKPTLTSSDIAQLCEEAMLHHFVAVCVPPCYVSLAKEFLQGTKILVATVVGFPLGYNTASIKVEEAIEAMNHGADEIDVVQNISLVKSGDFARAAEEIARITQEVHARHKAIKVILETSYLTDAEIVECCKCYGALGVDFVKTSTGFSDNGAKAETVALMRQNLPQNVQIKASGGIRTYADAMAMMQAGATRIGASAGVAILAEAAQKSADA